MVGFATKYIMEGTRFRVKRNRLPDQGFEVINKGWGVIANISGPDLPPGSRRKAGNLDNIGRRNKATFDPGGTPYETFQEALIALI